MSLLTRNVSLVGLASVMLFSLGCGELPGNSPDDSVTGTTSALQSVNPTFIVLSDNRSASNGVLTLQDLGTGNSDSENVGTTLYPSGGSNPHNQSLMNWTNTPSNRLQRIGVGQGVYVEFPTYSSIKVRDFGTTSVSTMRVTLRVDINGSCHEDYEDIDWHTPPLLYFNGNGATWDGSCNRGNLLRTSP